MPSRNGNRRFANMFRVMRSSFRRESISPWATIVTTARTAVTGDSWTATPLWGVLSWFIGPWTQRAATIPGTAPSGRVCPVFSRRWCTCPLERDGAACSIRCIRAPIDGKTNKCKRPFQLVYGVARLYLFPHDSAKLPNWMTYLQKWWKIALAVVCTVIALQAGVSLMARTRRVHAYLVAHLERAFGRRVEVESFDARILPSPQLDANGVTVGEDPSFGQEYFLRAERLSAGLRWTGLLRGHFEFGTMSLGIPSLILVQNS